MLTLQEMARARARQRFNRSFRSDDISKFDQKVNLIESKRAIFLLKISMTLKIRYAC